MTIAAWYATLAIHETGHCIATWLSGGSIDRVEIPLVGFSQTHYRDKPQPLFTTWAGPATGALFAFALFAIASNLHNRTRQIALFFAGFSLILNGTYLGLGGFLRIGDCAELLKHGASQWQLITFGAIATPLGLYSWHRMGPVKGWFCT